MTSAPAPSPVLAWPVHPAAGLFPLLPDAELCELAQDIGEHGLHEPVWLWEDPERGPVLVDGRNRALACQLAGVPVATRFYRGADPIGFSLSLNVKRRHLTAGQRDFLGADVERLYAEEAARRKAQAPGRPQGAKQSSLVADLRQETERDRKSAERAAKVVGASGRGVSQAKRGASPARRGSAPRRRRGPARGGS